MKHEHYFYSFVNLLLNLHFHLISNYDVGTLPLIKLHCQEAVLNSQKELEVLLLQMQSKQPASSHLLPCAGVLCCKSPKYRVLTH